MHAAGASPPPAPDDRGDDDEDPPAPDASATLGSTSDDASPSEDASDASDASEEEEEEEEGSQEEGYWVGALAGEASDDLSDDDLFDSDEEEDESSVDTFDDDQMHFEIEGTIPLGDAADPSGPTPLDRDRDPSARAAAHHPGVAVDAEELVGPSYLLADGAAIPHATSMTHHQGSDAVGAAGPGVLLVTGPRDVRALDATSGPTRGDVLGQTAEKLPFQVYSVSCDEARRLVAVCGAVGYGDRNVNLAVFRLRENNSDSENTPVARPPGGGGSSSSPSSSLTFVPVAEKGVGAMSEYGREMLNCVRFGKLATGASPSAAELAKDVLVCASQDGHCYALSVELEGDAHADLTEEARIDFPAAANAAAASPDGRCVAVVGDADFVRLTGGPRGYSAAAAPITHFLPVDGDPGSVGVVTGEPQGGMYVAWSADSETLAVTSDSLHAVAVWRVTVANEDLPMSTLPDRVLSARRVAYLRDHAHPCLPVTFLPSDPRVLVWAERGGRVHAYDLRAAEREDGAMKGSSEGSGAARGAGAGDAARLREGGAAEEGDPSEGGAAEEGSTVHSDRFAVDLSPSRFPFGAILDGPEGPGSRRRSSVAPNFNPIASGVDVCLYPLGEAEGDGDDAGAVSVLNDRRGGNNGNTTTRTTRSNAGGRRDVSDVSSEVRARPRVPQRRYVQTIRERVRGLYVTGLCATAAPAPPMTKYAYGASRGGDGGGCSDSQGLRGARALHVPPPPYDLVYVGVPSGVLRYRFSTQWTPETHADFPRAFRDAARTFLLCARADFDREDEGVVVTLGDMPAEVLARILGLAATPVSAWVGVGGFSNSRGTNKQSEAEEEGKKRARETDGPKEERARA